MERYAGNWWPKGIGLALAVLLAVSLFTFHPFDPTLLNLLYPSGGVRNALGLPGALVGGSLLEGFGAAAWLIPLLIVNWAAFRRKRPRAAHYAGYSGLLLVFLASFHGLLADDPLPGVWQPGLFGWVGGRWAEATTGGFLGGAILLCGAGYCLTRVVYGVSWRGRVRELAAFGRYFLARGDELLRRGTRTVRRGIAGAVLLGDTARDEIGRRLLAGSRNLKRAVAGWRPFPYRPTLPNRRRKGGARNPALVESWGRRPRAAGSDLPAGTDPFDAWFAGNRRESPPGNVAVNDDPAAVDATVDSVPVTPPDGAKTDAASVTAPDDRIA